MAKITVQAHPGAKKNAIMRFEGGVWHIRIAAPPVEGKANKKLVDFLSEILDVSKHRLTIEKGTTSRKKLIIIEGLTEKEAEERLTCFIN